MLTIKLIKYIRRSCIFFFLRKNYEIYAMKAAARLPSSFNPLLFLPRKCVFDMTHFHDQPLLIHVVSVNIISVRHSRRGSLRVFSSSSVVLIRGP